MFTLNLTFSWEQIVGTKLKVEKVLTKSVVDMS